MNRKKGRRKILPSPLSSCAKTARLLVSLERDVGHIAVAIREPYRVATVHGQQPKAAGFVTIGNESDVHSVVP